MSFRPLPPTACWQHRGLRSGFEVAWFTAREHGWRIDGTTAAIEDAQTSAVTYRIEVDAAWVTRSAHVTARTATGQHETWLESDGAGRWLVNADPAPHLDGCLDVDRGPADDHPRRLSQQVSGQNGSRPLQPSSAGSHSSPHTH